MDEETRAFIEAEGERTRRHVGGLVEELRREVQAVRAEGEETRREVQAVRAEGEETRREVQAVRAEGEETRRHVGGLAEGLRREVQAVRAEGEETRRHVGVLVEGLRGDLQAVAEGVAANHEGLVGFQQDVDQRFAETHALMQAGFASLRRGIDEIRAGR